MRVPALVALALRRTGCDASTDVERTLSTELLRLYIPDNKIRVKNKCLKMNAEQEGSS